jgi:hypothetical protein
MPDYICSIDLGTSLINGLSRGCCIAVSIEGEGTGIPIFIAEEKMSSPRHFASR